MEKEELIGKTISDASMIYSGIHLRSIMLIFKDNTRLRLDAQRNGLISYDIAKWSNDPSSPTGAETKPEKASNNQNSVNVPNQSAPRQFGAAPLLDLYFAQNKSSIIMSRKTWGSEDQPDDVEIINIPLEVIDRINKGEVVKYDGVRISSSSQESLAGILNEPPWNKETNVDSLQYQ